MEELQEKFENLAPQITASTPNTSLKIPCVQLPNISSLNTTFSVNAPSDARSELTDKICDLGPNWPHEDLKVSFQDASTENLLKYLTRVS